MIEFRGACGKKISINPAHVEYVQESEFMNKYCTLICFSSGKKVLVYDTYSYVVDKLEQIVHHIDDNGIYSRKSENLDDLTDDEREKVAAIVDRMIGKN